MSTKLKKPPSVTSRSCWPGLLAEIQHGMTGVNVVNVKHDDWCPAVKSFSMMDCVCSLEIVVEHVG